MSDDSIIGETDIEKVRTIARDLLCRNTALENENAVMLKEITRLTLELAGTTDMDKQYALGECECGEARPSERRRLPRGERVECAERIEAPRGHRPRRDVTSEALASGGGQRCRQSGHPPILIGSQRVVPWALPQTPSATAGRPSLHTEPEKIQPNVRRRPRVGHIAAGGGAPAALVLPLRSIGA